MADDRAVETEVVALDADLTEVVFDVDSVDLDTITPYANAPGDVQMQVLAARRAVGTLLFERAEMLEIATSSDLDATQFETKAEVDDSLNDIDAAKIRVTARRSRVLAEKCRFLARQAELEIMAHINGLQK